VTTGSASPATTNKTMAQMTILTNLLFLMALLWEIDREENEARTEENLALFVSSRLIFL
jgi:hypothetical protein